MSDSWTRRLMVAALMVLLHLPLIYQARSLYGDLGANADVLHVGPLNAAVLILLLVLPHLVFTLSGIHWNPARAHPGEIV